MMTVTGSKSGFEKYVRSKKTICAEVKKINLKKAEKGKPPPRVHAPTFQ